MIRILIILILLTGCTITISGCSGKQILPTPIGELKALDNFWKLLGDKKEDDKDE